MVGREIDPSDIGKHQKLIKAAQEDMAQIDVLVCGRCLNVFHFVEEFKDHKRSNCSSESNSIRECPDTKPKIWAFLLWKATQLNNKESNTNGHNSWTLYQTWVKMDESIRETWIVAGRTIQSFAKMGQGGLQEMPVKITKTVVDNNAGAALQPRKLPINQSKPIVANLKPVTKTGDEENDLSPTKTDSTIAGQQQHRIIKKPALTTQNKVNTSTPLQKPLSRRAKRTIPNTVGEFAEETVEKIVAKRFNPRRKMHEYLVKWEGRTHEHNTWEPQIHLENVPQILEIFEKQLAKQKEQRAALQAKQQAATLATAVKVVDINKKDTAISNNVSSSSASQTNKLSNTTPTDESKLNLLSPAGSDSSRLSSRILKNKSNEHAKQWENDSNDWSLNNSTGVMAVKRKINDSDYGDSATPTITDQDLEEDLIPSHTVKRMKNGNTVSVKVETKHERNTTVESKVIKVNGSMQNSSSGSLLNATEATSAEVIITQDVSASGVVKKPGFNGIAIANSSSQKPEAQIRVLSKGESMTSCSGIIRIGDDQKSNNESGTTQQRLIGNNRGGQQKSGTQSSFGNTQITQIGGNSASRLQPGQTRNVSGVIQRQVGKSTTGNSTRALQTPPRTTTIIQRTSLSPGIQQTSPTSGRMIIPRNVNKGTQQSKNVTPEQKIFQLSKSGDLKVTKKIMSKEPTSHAKQMQQQQQHQQQQHQQQQQQQQQQRATHQQQVQIQKVQQIVPPTPRQSSTALLRQKQSEVKTAVMDVSAFAHDDMQQVATLCPITGKILGQADDQLDQDQFHQLQQLQSGVLLATTEQQLQQQQQQLQEHELQEIDPTLLLTGDQQMLTHDDGTPLLVTGEDGTVYQVAGKNAEGQTILVTQGANGEQQFAYVAAAEGDDSGVLTLDNAVAEAVAQLSPEQQAEALAAAAAHGAGEGQYIFKTQDDGTTGLVSMSEAELAQHQAAAMAAQQQHGQLSIQTGSESGESQDTNIPAEVVQADLPSPGGTRRVVLLLQDGTFMMTEMHDDEYKALNITA